MRLLLDSNVLVASLLSRGLCADLVALVTSLHDIDRVRALYCPTIESEVMRLLKGKLGANEGQMESARQFFATLDRVPDGVWTAPADFPDPDDVPIVGAALAVGADLFVTGDKALLALERIERLPIRSPRDAYLLLRGL